MREAELKVRTKEFALRCIKLAGAMPSGPTGKVIGGQLLRCGTSVGANYRAACRGRSKAEFVSKLGIVEEEADESVYWMELMIDAGLLPAARIRPLLDEANQLVAIMVASRRSASTQIKTANATASHLNQKSKI